MTIDQAYTWVHNHMGEIALGGFVLGQLVLLLPDGPFKTRAGNVLHGLFTSVYVMKDGVSPTSARVPSIPPPPPVPANDTGAKP